MKNIIYNLFALSVCLSVFNLTAQIRFEKTSGPYGASIRALEEDANGNIYAGTWLGGIYRLQNGDSVWQHLDIKLNFGGIWDIEHRADNMIFAASNSGIYRSDDNGETWELGYEGMSNTFCRSVAVYHADTVFAGSNGAGVYRSVDGGQTWEVKTNGIGTDQILRIIVGDSSRLYAATNSKGVFISEDGGENWEARNEGLTSLKVNDLMLSDSKYLFAATFNGIFRSNDQGKTWDDVYRGPAFWSVGKDGDGNIYGSVVGRYVISSDGGDTWTEFMDGPANDLIHDFDRLSSGKLLAGTSSNGVFERESLASEWGRRIEGLSNLNIATHDVDANGNIFVGAANGIFKSTDFGENWVSLNDLLPRTNIEELTVTKQNIILASPNNASIFFSKDEGATWAIPDSGMDARDIRAFGESPNGSIYAGSSGGELFRSKDGAIRWEKLNTGFAEEEVGVIGSNEEGHVFAGVWFNGVYRSTDSGETWTLFNEGISSDFRPEAFLFLPNQEILMGGFSDVLRSTDNGETWVSTNLFKQVQTIEIDADGNVFAGTRGLGVYQLIHGEEVWTQQEEGLRHLDVKHLTLHQDSILLTSTAGGSVHKGYVNIQIVGITRGSLPSFEVYPNPFSGKTFFSYNLPESGKVTLKIFDTTGREVGTLLNDRYQKKGEHNIPWTIEGRISSGVYFYVLGFKDIVQSGRILVK